MIFLNKKTKYSVLLIRLSSMGDVILTTPLIRQIKQKEPEAEIDFLVGSQSAAILQSNPYIRKVIPYDKSISPLNYIYHNNKFFFADGLESYDIVIDLQNSFRTKVFRIGLSKTVLKMKKNRFNKLRLVYLKQIDKIKLPPLPEIYRSVVAQLNIEDDAKGLELWLPEEVGLSIYPPEKRSQDLSNLIIDNNYALKIAIAPGAKHFTKRWLPERFAELINQLSGRLNAEFILLGGLEDKEICSFIRKNTIAKVRNHAGVASIIETTRLLDSCHLLITNDTGIMHIGAARHIPIVAIFGSTVTNFGFIPFRTKNMIVEKNIGCRPCTHIGRAKCPRRHFNCMNMITTGDVGNACLELLSIMKLRL